MPVSSGVPCPHFEFREYARAVFRAGFGGRREDSSLVIEAGLFDLTAGHIDRMKSSESFFGSRVSDRQRGFVREKKLSEIRTGHISCYVWHLLCSPWHGLLSDSS